MTIFFNHLIEAFLVSSTVVSVVGFVSHRISANAKSQVYLPTPQERALLLKRNERLREEHERRRNEGHRLEPDPPRSGPKPPPSG